MSVTGPAEILVVEFDGPLGAAVPEALSAAIGEALTPGGSAALVVYEHVWARPLAGALQDAGGRIALRHHVPAADAERALAALEL
jgi:hypothetical protein